MAARFGSYFELGAAHFTVHAIAESVDLCIFDGLGERSISMRRDGNTWRHTEENPPNEIVYAYRIDGKGPHLLDPYARRLTKEGRALLKRDDFDWQGDMSPNHSWADTIIYECHVKGMTQLHSGIAPELRGTFSGFASERMIRHLKKMGVTAVEFLPVMAKFDDAFLLERGLTNYWGYSPLSYFAPESTYTFGDSVDEFKSMIKTLHANGIEVILDVVYNHTCEGNLQLPAISWVGFDKNYYHREDYTGCGNSLNLSYAPTRHMVFDSLMYWASEMHVDGFRFDLATTLCRDASGTVTFDFFSELAAHPLLGQLKLIAEPWDLGPDGYQLGKFPEPIREWNDRFRDTARRALRGDVSPAELAKAMVSGRPFIHFITCHDGFTLADMNRYTRKQNAANKEDNRDGADENLSTNWGVEGNTAPAEILRLRDRAHRDAFALLLLSPGTPMILGGDELGRSQNGNNNAYCQDNEISWLSWSRDSDYSSLIADLVRLRKGSQTPDSELFCAVNRTALPVPIDLKGRQIRLLYATEQGIVDKVLNAENGFLAEPYSLAVFQRPLS